MKKVVNLLLFLGFFLLFAVNINAAADDDLSPESKEQVAKQAEAINKYCKENTQLNGCLYDKNNSLYTKTIKKTYNWNCSELDSKNCYGGLFDVGYENGVTIPDGLPLTRGYQAFDGNGNAVYAGCYKYNTNNDTYFIFQIVYGNSSGKNCGVKKSFVVPAEGVGACYTENNCYGGSCKNCTSFKFTGKYQMLPTTLDLSSTFAHLSNWKAVKNGDCPKVFGYTANTQWYTLTSNKYTFSENADDFSAVVDTIAFKSGEQYVTRPGCTVEDTSGKEEAQSLLNEILTEINNKQCPAKLEDMISFEADFENWYKNLEDDNKYRVLWSLGLSSEVTKESVETQINGAIKNKIKECQYKICEITSEQKTKIEQNLGSECKNGCTISNVRPQSENEEARCYCCGSSQGCIYEWKVVDSNDGKSCSLQPTIPQTQCIGTSSEYQCRKCLIAAYEKAGLSDNQKVCMAGNDIAALLTQLNLERANDLEAEKALEREQEENSQLREDIFNRIGRQPTPPDLGFAEVGTCLEILEESFVKIIKVTITIIQIVAALIVIVKGMIILIPAIVSKDMEALKKSVKTLIILAIILIAIFLIKPIASIIGGLFEYDLSCIL